ncbi:MAG: hypothetical protein M3503_02555 [Actinomycetota bacterium]|nr:hypothetical protein [Actinomycetota bacterium]
MKRSIERLRHEEDGFGIVVAIIVGLVLTAGGITMLSLAVHQSEGSAQERDRERAFAAAEAAVNEAMSMMSYDPRRCPGVGGEPVRTGSLPGGGEYEFSFVVPEARFSCSDPLTVDRYIVAKAWAPSRTAPRAQRRQVEQQIKLKPLDGFKYALFAAPGGITSGNNMTVNGDVYADQDLLIAQQSKVFGSVTGQQLVSVDNNSIVSGDLWARGNIALLGAGSLVQGDAKSSGGEKVDTTGAVVGAYAGNISNLGSIEKKAIATGTISGTGKFGSKVTTTVSPPPRQALPAFDTTAVPYTMVHSSPTAFNGFFSNATSSFSGLHRVNGSSGTATFDKAFKVLSDSTSMVVADGPVLLSRDVEATSQGTATLAIVSKAVSAPGDAVPSILLSNQQKFPPNMLVVLYAPNGCVEFRNLKQFTGVVYAKCLKLDQNFTITYKEPPPLAGFDWTTASATHFEIEAYTFREVRFQP